MAAPSPVIASLSWMPSRTALVLRDSSFEKLLPALFQSLRSHVLAVHLHDDVVGDQDICLSLASRPQARTTVLQPDVVR